MRVNAIPFILVPLFFIGIFSGTWEAWLLPVAWAFSELDVVVPDVARR